MNRKSIWKRKLYSILLVFFIFYFLSIFSMVLLFRFLFSFFSPIFYVINILFFIQIAYFIFCKFYTKIKKIMVREFPMVVFCTRYDDFLVYYVY
jgi:hypothetical protein